MNISRLYAIIDADLCQQRGGSVRAVALGLRRGNVTLLQYRNKTGSSVEILADIAGLRSAFSGCDCTLLVNDRSDLALLGNCDGVHLGQDDLIPEDARSILGAEKLIGISTHTDEQLHRADYGTADYIAIGPVFATSTKSDAAPVVGLEGVRRARALTSKPLVAIGAITRANARSVIDAGADSLAVISELLVPGETPEKVARDFLNLFR